MDKFRELLWRFGMFITLGVLLIAFAGPGSVKAASTPGSSLTTSPVSTDLVGKPGSTVSTTLHVMNNGPIATPIHVRLDEFKASGNLGQANIYTPPSGDVSSHWVHFSESTFIAQPQIWHNITMTITLPTSASLGYYYAVLFSPQLSLPNSIAPTNPLKSANAIFVLVNALSPNAKPQLTVTSFSSAKSIYQYLPATLSINVHNNGNIFLIANGNVFISRTRNGPPLDTLTVNSSQGNILPDTNRLFQVQWSNGFPVYQYKRLDGQVVSSKSGAPIEQLQWDFAHASSFRFGKYYTHLVLVYNNGVRDIPVTSEVSFWVIPWFLLIGLVVFLALVLVGVLTIGKTLFKGVHKPTKQHRI